MTSKQRVCSYRVLGVLNLIHQPKAGDDQGILEQCNETQTRNELIGDNCFCYLFDQSTNKDANIKTYLHADVKMK